MSGTSTVRTFGAGTLYLRCLAWGLATGGFAGAVTGVMSIFGYTAGRKNTVTVSPVDALSGAAFGALLGGVIGLMVAVIPSAVGGLFVTGLIRHLHPQPSSRVRVQRDLQRIFAAFAALLNAALLLAIFTRGKGVSSLASSLPHLVVVDLCVALILWRASASISRALVGGEHELPPPSPRARAW